MFRPDPSDSSAAVRFLKGVQQWLHETDDAPNVVNLRLTNDRPCVVYQAASDDYDPAAIRVAAGELVNVLGGCAGAFRYVEYAVEEVTVVGLPNDREVHPAALRWRLEADWVREYVEGELSLDELLERVDDTMELAEHL